MAATYRRSRIGSSLFTWQRTDSPLVTSFPPLAPTAKRDVGVKSVKQGGALFPEKSITKECLTFTISRRLRSEAHLQMRNCHMAFPVRLFRGKLSWSSGPSSCRNVWTLWEELVASSGELNESFLMRRQIRNLSTTSAFGTFLRRSQC